MENVIWQPKNIRCDSGLDIILDYEFAKDASSMKITQEQADRFQELPKELIRFTNEPEPYLFYRGTFLLDQITIDGGKGVWLSLQDRYNISGVTGNQEHRPFEYSSHNFDFGPSNHYVLTALKLFDIWAEYFGIFRESK